MSSQVTPIAMENETKGATMGASTIADRTAFSTRAVSAGVCDTPDLAEMVLEDFRKKRRDDHS